MTVTVSTHTATPTWTAAGLRTIFEQSFIANGIMTAWHDSFTAGSNAIGVLKKDFDVSKTYGSTYYIFKFSTTTINILITGGWDSTNHVPSGVLYDTYPGSWSASTVNSSADALVTLNNRGQAIATIDIITTYGFNLSSTTTISLSGYRSGIDPSIVFFVLGNGSSGATFMLPKAPASYIDLDKFYYSGFYQVLGNTNATENFLAFNAGYATSTRAVPKGIGVAKDTNLTYTNDMSYTASRSVVYGVPGKTSTTSSTSNLSSTIDSHVSVLYLPVLASSQMTSGEDLSYIHTGVFYSPYEATPNLPADFGVYATLDTNTAWVPGDNFVVSAGVEEYTILAGRDSISSSAGHISLVARTV